MKNTVHVYRDNLARARNNISLALKFIGLESLTDHKRTLVEIERILNEMVSRVDKARKSAE
ncbi:unnamed protein product [marine sediment metagenome]|uniref:Uncharacterized protein n=1 Tax=marine sediment metagenome TaxID=412755 RepID=X1MRH2_9ZZZZ